MAPLAIFLASNAMGFMHAQRQTGPMQTYTYQFVRGYLIVMVDGRPCVLDTGSPFSVGYAPIVIADKEFPVYDSYLDVCPAYLADHIGTKVEGLIGADILAEFNVNIRHAERLIEFSSYSSGHAVFLPLNNFMNVPILPIKVCGRIVRAFFDTGATLSYLLPEILAGLDSSGRQEEFYPLLGSFLTDVYSTAVGVGGEEREFRFGELPEELRMMLEAGQVQAIIGTDLLKHFDLSFSLRDKRMRLDPVSRMELAS
jgi:hypothetical protein